MTRFIASRLMQGFIVIAGVTTIVFVLTRLVGDPAQALLPIEASEAERQAAERRFSVAALAERHERFYVQVMTAPRDLSSAVLGRDTTLHGLP